MIAIISIQLTEFGLPAIRDVTCMQVNPFVDLSAVMMRRLRCRLKVTMRPRTRQDMTAQLSHAGVTYNQKLPLSVDIEETRLGSLQLAHTTY
jgi:hypothetical protein